MYEYITYLPPGPMQYMFTDLKNELNTNFHTIIIKPRDKEIDLRDKAFIKIRKKKCYFKKENSVFKDY